MQPICRAPLRYLSTVSTKYQPLHSSAASLHATLFVLSFYSEPPSAVNGLSVVIQPNATSPVTANISWTTVIDNATGISPGGNQTLSYFVEVSNSTSAVLFTDTVDHPTNTVEAPNLPACENLTVSVTAENLFFIGTPASEDFMTVEPGQ